MSTEILLVRHASHDLLGRVLAGRMPGVHLGEGGKEEAKLLAHRLSRRPVVAAYAGPLERAQETAGPIAARHALRVLSTRCIDEIDFGAWSGRRFDELEVDPCWRRWNSRRATARAPDGESMPEVQSRVLQVLRSIARRHPGETVVAVSHGDVIKAALVHFLGRPIEAIDDFDVAPAAISTVVLTESAGEVVEVNRAP